MKVVLGDLIGPDGVFIDGDWIESKDQDPNGEVRLIQLADVGDGAFLDKSSRFLTSSKARELRCTFLEPGDLLIARMPDPIGRACIFPELEQPCVTVVDVCVLRSDHSKVCPRWLLHKINSLGFRSDLEGWLTGTTRTRISRGNLAKITFDLPPLDEQRRIAAILDQADALRRKRKRALELLDGLTQSIFLEMFGDLVASSRFDRGPINDWVEDFETGKNLAPDPDATASDAFRVLKVSAVTSGSFDTTKSKPLPANYLPPPSHLVQQGDLLFSRANTTELIGAVAYVDRIAERLVLPDKIWRFCWRKENEPHPLFIHALFSTPKFRLQISKRSTGTSGSMKNISKEKVLSIKVGQPTRAQQDAFVERASVVATARACSAKQRALIEAQFSSLQHRAFSGHL